MMRGNLNLKNDWKQYLFQWEAVLILIFIIINIINALISEYYLNLGKLINITQSFLDKAFIVLPMTLVLLLGEIDISVGSTVALSSVLMAISYNNLGLPMWVAVIICLLTGIICGFINGIILVKFKELPPMIVTLSTMLLYRGIALVILEDQASGGFPDWFEFLGWGSVLGIPSILILFILFCVLFILLLHKTNFGRRIYAIGSNRTASLFSGVNIDRIRVTVYMLTGFMSAVTALFLVSRMDSTRPNVATGYELDVIAMVVLGGVSSAGGVGRMYGPIISVFLIGFLRYGLGLVNVQAPALLVIIGCLLVGAVLIPNLRKGGTIQGKIKKSVT